MNYLKVSVGILFALSLSRFIPHPPNFTSLIALSFYVPVFFGIRFLPALLASFFITDFFIGFHNLTFFTWGSVVIIGLISKYFKSNMINRITGSLFGACLFFIITNLGVWMLGNYSYTFEGFLLCYKLAIPFFTYSIISTFIFAGIIECIYKILFMKQKLSIK
tara:strand:- start:4152 stop:4640 length:489 start_codon:yes stop_codon:yes gene_type:complete